MGWEWKHVLLYLANTLAVHGLTCPICFQCRGRPDFYFKVFCTTLSQTPLSCGLRMWTDGSLWQNFPAFFTLRVSHLHGYSEIRFSKVSLHSLNTQAFSTCMNSLMRGSNTIPFFPKILHRHLGAGEMSQRLEKHIVLAEDPNPHLRWLTNTC